MIITKRKQDEAIANYSLKPRNPNFMTHQWLHCLINFYYLLNWIDVLLSTNSIISTLSIRWSNHIFSHSYWNIHRYWRLTSDDNAYYLRSMTMANDWKSIQNLSNIISNYLEVGSIAGLCKLDHASIGSSLSIPIVFSSITISMALLSFFVNLSKLAR